MVSVPSRLRSEQSIRHAASVFIAAYRCANPETLNGALVRQMASTFLTPLTWVLGIDARPEGYSNLGEGVARLEKLDGMGAVPDLSNEEIEQFIAEAFSP